MDNIKLINLCSRTWSLTALSLIAHGTSARVSPLAAQAGCGRTSMSASVDHLVNIGMLERNPGHGHPLRPEYRLTAAGETTAEWAAQLFSLVKSEQHKPILRNKWSLPLLDCLPEEKRYADLRRALNPVTDRALSNCLMSLRKISMIKRSVSNHSSPPIVSYMTLKQGQILNQHLSNLPRAC